MSAYIVSPEHIKQLALFASERTGGYGQGHCRVDPRYLNGAKECSGLTLANHYADILYQENVRSVRARYPDDKWDDLPGLIVKPIRVVCKPQDAVKVSVVAILKMCAGLEYQSCETTDYRSTLGFRLLDSIRGAAIKELPGYEDAPWDYNEEQKAA